MADLSRDVTGEAKDWSMGTGSLTVDLAQFIWAFLRRARGKEWIVTLRPASRVRNRSQHGA